MRVAPTVDDADAAEELSLHLLLDADGIPGEDRLMQVASTPLPLVTVVAVMRATLNDPERDRAAALNAFRCT